MTPTSVKVIWQISVASGIVGYRIYYTMYPNKEIETWQRMEIGPFFEAVIDTLEPHSMYALKVSAKSVDGRYGNLSETITTRNEPG